MPESTLTPAPVSTVTFPDAMKADRRWIALLASILRVNNSTRNSSGGKVGIDIRIAGVFDDKKI